MARDNTRNDQPGGLTYRDAGVDIDAGAELIRRIGPAAARTRRPEMLAGLGGFAALTRLPRGYEHPVLVTGTLSVEGIEDEAGYAAGCFVLSGTSVTKEF